MLTNACRRPKRQVPNIIIDETEQLAYIRRPRPLSVSLDFPRVGLRSNRGTVTEPSMKPFLSFLLLVLGFALPSLAHPGAHEGEECEVAIVGAGPGGLYTAWRLAVDAAVVAPEKICIFEAKVRPGGRLLTVTDPVPGFEGYTVDVGGYRYVRPDLSPEIFKHRFRLPAAYPYS